jgi:predicted GIY-YIG superfamily endonuclease
MDDLKLYYVYILVSVPYPDRHYTGFTEDLPNRVDHHNSGANTSAAAYRPWRLQTAIAFTDREKALDFERYLKSGSGREFARRHL